MNKKLNRYAQGILVNDPTKVINTIPGNATTITGDGIFSQMNNIYDDPFAKKMEDLEKQLKSLKLDSLLMKLKILSLEGKFTQEEVTNIRKMLMSEDEASRTLANTIIENA